MKKTALRLGVAALAAAVAAGAGVAAIAAGSSAPLPDPDNKGALALYDAAGQPVTSGRLGDPVAAYAVGSGGLEAGPSASLFAYVINPAVAAGDWTGSQLSPASATPAPGAPAGLPGGPTATIGTGATTLAQFVHGYSGTSTGVELRLRTSAPGAPVDAAYDALDITVDPTAGTWSVGTSTATSTTTTLLVGPSTATVGTKLTLTATVTPASAAGTVQFYDGSAKVGSAVAVSNGTASATDTPTTGGTHSFKAVFTPTDATAYGASASEVTSYSVGAKTTSTTVSISPSAPKAGSKVTISSSTTAGAAGKVQFYYGTTKVGSPVTVSSGKAHSVAVLVTTAGNHTFKGVFTPTSPASYTSSTGSKVVKVAKATPTLTIGLASSVQHTAHATLTATVKVTNLTVTGKVTIYDGSHKLATVTLKSGKATYRLPLLKKGKHTIKVSYVASTSINAKSATTSITSK